MDILRLPSRNGLPPQWALLSIPMGQHASMAGIISRVMGLSAVAVPSFILARRVVATISTYLTRQLWALVQQHLMSSISYTGPNALTTGFRHWADKQGFIEMSTHLFASLGRSPPSEEIITRANGLIDCSESRHFVQYDLAPGTHRFLHSWHYIEIDVTREPESNRGYGKDRWNYVLRCFGRNTTPLKEILSQCILKGSKHKNRGVEIYRPNSSYNWWTPVKELSPRPLDTVILPDKIKKDVVNRINTFFHPDTKKQYAKKGIPYRLGFLFDGPPGTGKTSLSLALPGEFGSDELYSITIADPKMTDTKLSDLFSMIGDRAFILLEDIDVAGLVKRKAVKSGVKVEDTDEDDEGDEVDQKVEPSSGVTLSGLLNVLDGAYAKEGSVVIMTTNDKDALDRALIRAGRVDHTIKFRLASTAQIRDMFVAMYEGDEGFTSDSADAFAANFMDYKISPAELQGFMRDRMKQPTAAMDDIVQWWSEKKAENAKAVKDTQKTKLKSDEKNSTSRWGWMTWFRV
ncbi:P-loop containing nucleoside triphosphate hydrolase protein [Suillus subluteus]|nr:P-loop containing nucleoside triphosphate hydrolase protein [Suillus subluteus]